MARLPVNEPGSVKPLYGYGTLTALPVRADSSKAEMAATFARLSPFLVRAGLMEHVIAAARPTAAERYTTLWPRGHAFTRA